MSAPASPAGTIRLQPLPLLTLVADLNDVHAITRSWKSGDTFLCRLCERCTADHETGICLVLTEEAVTDGGAPLYSTLGTDCEPIPSPARSTLRPPFDLGLRSARG